MWLLRLFPRVAALATRTFYRTTVSGASIPGSGPLLLVGNHPNSLLDPLFLAAVAGRPVRFLAKAPLFSSSTTRWAVTAVGAIPVYRRSDDPTLVGQNANTFRAAHEALVAGAAVGIFPEGMSHDAPSLAPLRTGAARIALGARSLLGAEFPIVPVGLVFRNKEEFRSEAHVLVGDAISWDGVDGDADDGPAVKELTARIDLGLHGVTLNLETWEDAALISAAEEIYVAEQLADASHATRADRWRESAKILAAARSAADADALALVRDIRGHTRALSVFGLRPADLNAPKSFRSAAHWSARRVALPLWLVIAWVGAVLFWPPYRLTDLFVARSPADGSGRASAKLVVGVALFLAWMAVLTAGAWLGAGWRAGVVALILLPPLSFATMTFLEKSSAALQDARRFFLLRSRAAVLDELRARQAGLAKRLGALRERAGARQR